MDPDACAVIESFVPADFACNRWTSYWTARTEEGGE
jgi:hypothetical protein